ncbi:hypothetical protein [Streptomyces sp. MUSC 14]|uniref:hypothetical protein n=1 Tax=Streptomyces sp. MUSC 14 TaxID=1354889 RepID=UPI0011609418|nr:hypothetical protein [Streptomyces sp. MUSC 14]
MTLNNPGDRYNPIADYSSLIRIAAPQLPDALRRFALPVPPGRRARWVLTLVDIAFTDYYPANKDQGIDLGLRLSFASILLDFVERELNVHDPVVISREYIRFARLAVDEGARDVPASFRIDAVAARLLGCFPCAREQALRAAVVRRDRYREALNAGLQQGEEFDRAVSFEGGAEFLAVTVLVAELPWFRGKITDRDIAREAEAWLDIAPELGLGDDVEELLAVRRRRSGGGL